MTGARGAAFAALATTVGYVVGAKLGLSFAVVAEQVTAVWPPTGIALAAVLLVGPRLGPAVWLGAFLANATANEPLLTAAGIATGNTLEALVAAWLLQRVVGFGRSVDRLRDALGLVVLGALVSSAVSATIGVTSLVLGGVQPWAAFGRIWHVWWLGDAMGALVVAPLILTWAAGSQARWPVRRLVEAAGLLGALTGVSALVFAGGAGRLTSDHPLEYTIFPFLIWAALRFGQLGTATVTALASAIAIWGTARGVGPFVTGDPNASLILLQVFLGVMAISGLVLAAAINERDVAERRRTADYAVTHALAESGSLAEAAARILRAVGQSLGWPVGAVWIADEADQALRCVEVWQGPGRSFAEFEAVTRGSTFASGVGLPGRVWADGRAHWIPDVVRDGNFPRAPVAAREGLHGAFAFPIVLQGRTWGVVEFFSGEIERPDADFLERMTVIGSQIGQFIERRRAEMERTALLRREQTARAEAEAASRAKDEFLAMLGHELRNPLGAISTAVSALERTDAQAEQARHLRAIIARQAAHLARLVNDLLDVARVTSGKVLLHRQATDLREVAERCVTALQQAGRAGQHAIRLAGEAAPVEADPMRLEQVVANLLDNAVKYTPAGGRIDVVVEREKGEAVLRITDTGIGIPPEVLPQVFDLFVQGRQSLERAEGGLGLGLSLARRLVELHGGRITATSRGRDAGSEFVVRLPLATRPPDVLTATVPAPVGAPRRVLVIEDHRDAREGLSLLLRQWGHEVHEAEDGVQGLERLLALHPDVAFVDIGLPGLDGYSIARAVRAAPAGAGPYLGALTGYGQADDRRRAEEAGFDRHLVKPVEEGQLLSVFGALPRRR
jgi:signal transduction histidine kinase/integral membrane sensor domain MASE1